ncbi:hypothetical protein IT568_09195, partial [bacterium]|nr:hypothetical protein [bacterium]
MMELYKFYLTQSHFGADSKGVGVEKTTEWLHSDTIFSALVNSYARLHPNETTEKLLCSGKPKFQVSSGFLGKGEVLFFPRPNLPFPGQEEGNDEFLKNMKTLKKISFLRLETLKKWFENDSSENFCKQ